MPEIELHAEADEEMRAAASFYELQQAGLGEKFLDRLDEAFQSILANPTAYQTLTDRYRRRLVARFPYSVVYRAEPHRIFVLAVAHWKREPDYWKTRG